MYLRVYQLTNKQYPKKSASQGKEGGALKSSETSTCPLIRIINIREPRHKRKALLNMKLTSVLETIISLVAIIPGPRVTVASAGCNPSSILPLFSQQRPFFSSLCRPAARATEKEGNVEAGREGRGKFPQDNDTIPRDRTLALFPLYIRVSVFNTRPAGRASDYKDITSECPVYFPG